MTHCSLFSGIGGFDLAAEWMGWQNLFQVEIDPFCRKILRKNFPKVKLYDDIKKFDGAEWRGKCGIISGGFPCQPFSIAGKRKGDKDDRFLWSEMLRVVGEIRPQWVVAENVAGLLSIDGGMVFERVCVDLENIGYTVTPFVIPACAVGAPHRRDRIWIVAHADKMGRQRWRGESDRNGRKKNDGIQRGIEGFSAWDGFPTVSHVCRGNDGIPDRVDRIASLGNSIVPQVAFKVFKAIQSVEEAT